MKNLILLTETHHSILKKNANDCIVYLLPNPVLDHHDFNDMNSNQPNHFVLLKSGILLAVSANDSISWSLDLNNVLESGNDMNSDEIMWFHLSYDVNNDTLVALSRSGMITTVTLDGESVDLIGCFDNGIACAAWSEDSELLALTTYQMENSVQVPVLMIMNQTFEILSEVCLPQHDINQPISLCWNKKTDHLLVAISTHDIDDDTRKIRIFKGQTLENVAISRTEDGSGKLIPNLFAGCNIAWAGSNTSNLLASVQKKGRKVRNVVFLEQNGLQHGGFKLENREDYEEVERLCWNSESDLLVLLLSGEINGEIRSKIQLYYRSNYHWYLKYEIPFGLAGEKVSCIRLDESEAYSFSIALTDKSEKVYERWIHYRFAWDASTTTQKGTAVVVDGVYLNITDFQEVMIPPPMYEKRMSFDCPIISVIPFPSYLYSSSVNLLVQLSDGSLLFCDSRKAILTGKINESVYIRGKILLSSFISLGQSIRQCLVIDMNTFENEFHFRILAITGVSSSADELLSFTVILKTYAVSDSEHEVRDIEKTLVDGKILRQVNWLNFELNASSKLRGEALIELTDGTLLEFHSSLDYSDPSLTSCESEPLLLEPCPWIAAFKTEEGRMIVGMSDRSRLYFGERQLCDAVSSFQIAPNHGFLTYVTLGSRSQLRFLPLQALKEYDPLMGSEDYVSLFNDGYEPRSVERGSTIITILPNLPNIVLQLPRGNLEGICPRALLLPFVMELIYKEKYSDVLNLMRKQKIDMNLIVDLDPYKFLSNGGVEKMVEQVKQIDYLNLFIASLQNYDVTEWKYKLPSWLLHIKSTQDGVPSENMSSFDFSSKVNVICSKMRDVMIRVEQTNACKGIFLLPILSTFAKESPPQLQSALNLIKTRSQYLYDSSGLGGRNKSALMSEGAQNEIQYLAFLADYEILFDTALGMYDFELAKAVARNSQMDPKVYLPLLKRFREIPVFQAKYEIDLRLKRFESALRHLFKHGLAACNGIDHQTSELSEEHFLKCKEFILDHQLHEIGLELFEDYPQWYFQLMVLFGERLLKENRAELALSIFLSSTPKYLEGARSAARRCGDYQTFFAIFEGDDASKKNIAYEIANEVASNTSGLYSRREAHLLGARICLDYCQDTAGAVELLCNAEHWFEARRIALMCESYDIQKQIIDSAVVYAQICLSNFDTKIGEFTDSMKRYSEVLNIQRKKKVNGFDFENGSENDEAGSMFSMASNASNTSFRSNMSTSSVGTLASVSSIITAGSVNTFSLTNDDSMRHKSKYNNIGKYKKKKTKKSRRERKGLKPGSEEELNHLVSSLKNAIIDADHRSTIEETIRFLAQVDHFKIAMDLYGAYESFRVQIHDIQLHRIEEDTRKKKEEEQVARRNAEHYDHTILECEIEVDRISCPPLSEVLSSLFCYKVQRHPRV